jgi:hypothetical protein
VCRAGSVWPCTFFCSSFSVCRPCFPRESATSLKGKLCGLFDTLPRTEHKKAFLQYLLEHKALGSHPDLTQQGAASLLRLKIQMVAASYLSSAGSNTSLTSLMMLGRYFKAAPCKNRTRGKVSCQARQKQSWLLIPGENPPQRSSQGGGKLMGMNLTPKASVFTTSRHYPCGIHSSSKGGDWFLRLSLTKLPERAKTRSSKLKTSGLGISHSRKAACDQDDGGGVLLGGGRGLK